MTNLIPRLLLRKLEVLETTSGVIREWWYGCGERVVMTIVVSERDQAADGSFVARVAFGDAAEYEVTVVDQAGPGDENALDSVTVGGQAAASARVENYLGPEREPRPCRRAGDVQCRACIRGRRGRRVRARCPKTAAVAR